MAPPPPFAYMARRIYACRHRNRHNHNSKPRSNRRAHRPQPNRQQCPKLHRPTGKFRKIHRNTPYRVLYDYGIHIPALPNKIHINIRIRLYNIPHKHNNHKPVLDNRPPGHVWRYNSVCLLSVLLFTTARSARRKSRLYHATVRNNPWLRISAWDMLAKLLQSDVCFRMHSFLHSTP